MCGCHEAGWHKIKAHLESGLTFKYFVTLSPARAEKAKVSGYRRFDDLAQHFDVPVYYAQSYNLKHPTDQAFFAQQQFDILVQGGWQRLFPEAILDALRIGALGVHGSADFLPKGRGRSPLNWSLIEDKKRFIMSLFLITPGIDDGDVVDFEMFDITPFDTIRTLYYKYAIVTQRMEERTIPQLLNGTAKRYPQTGTPTHYPKRGPEDGAIDWETMDVWAIHNFIRAQTRPYPGAFATLDGRVFTIWGAQVFDTRITYPDLPYGAVVEAFDHHVVVKCRGGLLLVTDYELRQSPSYVESDDRKPERRRIITREVASTFSQA